MKTLLFGPANAGKTSLMRTACLGYAFVKVSDMKPTKGISRENFIFRGLLELTIWDAGGQENYIQKYFTDQKDVIFSEVEIPIFMVDSAVIDPKMKEIFDSFLDALFEYSPETSKIYILLNKIDLEESREDEVFSLLSGGVDKAILKKCEFTPVSVKTGSAQHRLIEILDTCIQKSQLETQRMNDIQICLESLKSQLNYDIILFNLPDGLVISSTFGEFEVEPLKYMKLELGSLESNIHSVFSNILKMKEGISEPIDLSLLVYESNTQLVLVKDFMENAVMVFFSDTNGSKDYSTIPDVLKIFTSKNDEISQLRSLIKVKRI
jgi:GTPase SAR1 family protein